MPGGKTVSVVAGDRAVRRSLEFTLEAEGFEVEPYATVASAGASASGQVRCVVVDDDVLRDGVGVELLSRINVPVILLADPLHALAGIEVARVLIKPYVGLALIESVVELTG